MEYTIYKANKKQTGSAVKFNLQKSGKYSFMKSAPQTAPMGGDRVYGWDDNQTINVKMELADLGAFLTVLIGLKEEIKLFHKTDVDNKIVELKHVPDRGGFSLSVSHQITGNTNVNRTFLGISYEESLVLKVYIENTIKAMLEARVWSPE